MLYLDKVNILSAVTSSLCPRGRVFPIVTGDSSSLLTVRVTQQTLLFLHPILLSNLMSSLVILLHLLFPPSPPHPASLSSPGLSEWSPAAADWCLATGLPKVFLRSPRGCLGGRRKKLYTKNSIQIINKDIYIERKFKTKSGSQRQPKLREDKKS